MQSSLFSCKVMDYSYANGPISNAVPQRRTSAVSVDNLEATIPAHFQQFPASIASDLNEIASKLGAS